MNSRSTIGGQMPTGRKRRIGGPSNLNRISPSPVWLFVNSLNCLVSDQSSVALKVVSATSKRSLHLDILGCIPFLNRTETTRQVVGHDSPQRHITSRPFIMQYCIFLLSPSMQFCIILF